MRRAKSRLPAVLQALSRSISPFVGRINNYARLRACACKCVSYIVPTRRTTACQVACSLQRSGAETIRAMHTEPLLKSSRQTA